MTKTTTSYVKLVRDEHGTIIDSENADHLVREPLTDDELLNIYLKTNGIEFYKSFARAIERAHGITAKD